MCVGSYGSVCFANGCLLDVEPDLVVLEVSMFGPMLNDLLSNSSVVCPVGSICSQCDLQISVGLGKQIGLCPFSFLSSVLCPVLYISL